MRLITSCFAGVFCLAIAGATPITLTFSGTGSGTVTSSTGTADFTNQAFTITFDSNTSDLVTIPVSDPDAGDISTPNPTTNTFVIGSLSGSLSGLTTSSGVFGPAVFLNTTTNNVGIWYFETADWLVTASGSYTSSFGLANDLTVTGLSPSDDGAFGNATTPGTGAAAMPSTIGAISFTSLSNVTFSEAVTPTVTTTAAIGAAVGTAPEPSTLTLFGIGIAGLAMGKLRRRRT